MTSLDIDAIRDYLLRVGCKIEYPILVNAFKQYLYNPDPNVQGKIRTQFKDYVNRLATVSLENNMKFIILRPEFRPPNYQMPPHGQESIPKPALDPKQTPPQQMFSPPNKPISHQHKQPAPRLSIQQNQTNHLPQPITNDVADSALVTPPVLSKRNQLLNQRPESLNLTTQMPPPRPPPRRRQSTASLFKPSPKPVENCREIIDLAKRSQGRVKEHASKLNSFTSISSLNALLPMRSNTMKENRLSRDTTICHLTSTLQRNGSHLTNRSRSSHREDESDSSSLQHIDPLRRKWIIEACNCNYGGLVNLLNEDPKLINYKDIVNGYTALHWAVKFGNLKLIRLLVEKHEASVNMKSSAGYTPLHVAYLFDNTEAVNLLLNSYQANPNIRDHSGRRPLQYQRSSN